jgi:hypothetical protein
MGEMDFDTAQRTYAYWLEQDGFEDYLYDAIRPDGPPGVYACMPDAGYDLPEQGAWIMVKEPPTTAIPDPPIYSMWLARPVYYSRIIRGRRGYTPGGSRAQINWPMLRARIVTPYGELTLLPGEYVPVKKLPEWMDQIGDGVSLHFMGPGVVEGDMAERVFQLRARGLRQRDALSLLLPELTDQGFCWLSLDGTGAEDYIEGAAACGS